MKSRNIYNIQKCLKTYDVYKLVSYDQKSIMTDLIRIENYRGYSRATGFDQYLRIRDHEKSWKESSMITGLFKTGDQNVFYGDHIKHGRKNLIVFQFSADRMKLMVDYYFGYPKFKEVINKYC